MADEPYDRLPVHPVVAGLTASIEHSFSVVAASRYALAAAETKKVLRASAGDAVEGFEQAVAEAKEAADAAHAAQTSLAETAQADPQRIQTAYELVQRDNALDRAKKADVDNLKPLAVDRYDKFTASPDRGEFTILAGYLGGCFRDEPNPWMQILFLTPKLARWLLIPLDGISLFNRVEDNTAAFGLRDLLWVQPQVRVVQGESADSVRGSYLNGPFVRADEFVASVRASTFARSGGGLLEEAVTPGCCPNTHPRP